MSNAKWVEIDDTVNLIGDNIELKNCCAKYVCNMLNSQDQEIAELEKQLEEKDSKIQELLDYTATLENGWNYQEYLKLQAQLNSQPKEIVEKIRTNFENKMKNRLWQEEYPVGKICNMINDVLDEILKEYGEE